MTRIKFCGLRSLEDIKAANMIRPDYIGFVFVPGRRRAISFDLAGKLRSSLDPGIDTVGVFIDEDPEVVAGLLLGGIIDIAQLHGNEDAAYIRRLKDLTSKPVIKAVIVKSEEDVKAAPGYGADYVLFDAGTGEGKAFDRRLLASYVEPYFLAGGLDAGNVGEAVRALAPYAVDVSSGIETDGVKDISKMTAFAAAVRKEGIL